MQEAVRTKGPAVWLDMDQQELDDAYDQEILAPNREMIVARRKAASERARATLGAPQRLAYGPTEIERLDIFRCGVANAPVNVFVHGGAWRRNVAADYALQAEMLNRAGAHGVIIDFINVDQAGGDLMPMYDQVRRALAWVYRNADSFGGDRNRIYVSAHSSGSHLSGVVLTRGWQEEGLPADAFKGAVLLSGMYDLEPVRRSKRSGYVKFTDEMVQALSGQRYLDGLHTPLVLAYGTGETREFQRQTRDFHAAVRAAGKPSELIVGEGYNHFELLETLANPYGLLGRLALAQMGLGSEVGSREGLLDQQCEAARDQRAGDGAAEHDLAHAVVEAAADDDADQHRRKQECGHDQNLARELADRPIADAADQRQGQQDRRHGGPVIVLGELDGVVIHREEHAAHGAEDRAGDPAGDAAERRRDRGRHQQLRPRPERAPQRIEAVGQHEHAEPPRQRVGVDPGKNPEPDRDTDEAARHELEHLGPGHMFAVLPDQRDAGGKADQRPGRHQQLDRHDETEQRQGDRGAEAARAARRIGQEHHHAAIDDGEGGQGIDGGGLRRRESHCFMRRPGMTMANIILRQTFPTSS